jgi:hypothetical protein
MSQLGFQLKAYDHLGKRLCYSSMGIQKDVIDDSCVVITAR